MRAGGEIGKNFLLVKISAYTVLVYLNFIRCVYVHDNSPTGVKSEISCMDTKEHYWLGLNSWKMGKYFANWEYCLCPCSCINPLCVITEFTVPLDIFKH